MCVVPEMIRANGILMNSTVVSDLKSQICGGGGLIVNFGADAAI